MTIVYVGPFLAVELADGTTFEKGKPVEVPATVGESLKDRPDFKVKEGK